MIYTDTAIARIRAYLKQTGIARFRLANMAGIPEGCLRNVHSDQWNPTSETLRVLESAIPGDFVPSAEQKKSKTKRRR